MAKNKGKALIESEQLILDIFDSITSNKMKLKVQKQMQKDAVEGDSKYHDLNTQVKDLKKQLLAVKAGIMATPAMVSLSNEIDGLKQEIKSDQLAISDYLEKYVSDYGTMIIENKDGKLLHIKRQFKLVKKTDGE